MKLLLMPMSLVFFFGCAITAPDGQKQLAKAIKEDRNKQNAFKDVHLGRPKFVKVRSYKKIQNGDIHSSHIIYLQIGREKLNLEELIGE